MQAVNYWGFLTASSISGGRGGAAGLVGTRGTKGSKSRYLNNGPSNAGDMVGEEPELERPRRARNGEYRVMIGRRNQTTFCDAMEVTSNKSGRARAGQQCLFADDAYGVFLELHVRSKGVTARVAK